MKITTLIFGAAISLNSVLSHAQLGAPAPLPQNKKVEGPSLEQTQEWLVNKFATMPTVITKKDAQQAPAVVVYHERQRLFFEGCKFTIASSQKSIRANDPIPDFNLKRGSIYATTGSLDQLNAERAEIEPYGFNDTTALAMVNIYTTGKSRVLLSPSFSFSALLYGSDLLYAMNTAMNRTDVASSRSDRSSIRFSTPDVETAQSTINAFKHAVTLCRQKLADEKSAKPARPKELF